jgi:hypothetical protein
MKTNEIIAVSALVIVFFIILIKFLKRIAWILHEGLNREKSKPPIRKGMKAISNNIPEIIKELESRRTS